MNISFETIINTKCEDFIEKHEQFCKIALQDRPIRPQQNDAILTQALKFNSDVNKATEEAKAKSLSDITMYFNISSTFHDARTKHKSILSPTVQLELWGLEQAWLTQGMLRTRNFSKVCFALILLLWGALSKYGTRPGRLFAAFFTAWFLSTLALYSIGHQNKESKVTENSSSSMESIQLCDRVDVNPSDSDNNTEPESGVSLDDKNTSNRYATQDRSIASNFPKVMPNDNVDVRTIDQAVQDYSSIIKNERNGKDGAKNKGGDNISPNDKITDEQFVPATVSNRNLEYESNTDSLLETNDTNTTTKTNIKQSHIEAKEHSLQTTLDKPHVDFVYTLSQAMYTSFSAIVGVGNVDTSPANGLTFYIVLILDTIFGLIVMACFLSIIGIYLLTGDE